MDSYIWTHQSELTSKKLTFLSLVWTLDADLLRAMADRDGHRDR